MGEQAARLAEPGQTILLADGKSYTNRYVGQPANDNEPASTTTNEVIERRTDLAQRAAHTEAELEQHARVARLQFKEGFAWDGHAANDNADWPLQKLLKRDGEEDLLKVANRYRHLYTAAHRLPDLGSGTTIGEDVDVLRRDEWVDPIGARTLSDVLSTYGRHSGKLKRGKVRRSTATTALCSDGSKAIIAENADPETEAESDTWDGKRYKPVKKPWAGDNPIIETIDAKAELRRVRAILQDALYLEAVEAAVIDDMTMVDIGRDIGGYQNRQQQQSVGATLVKFGLIILRREMRWPAM